MISSSSGCNFKPSRTWTLTTFTYNWRYCSVRNITRPKRRSYNCRAWPRPGWNWKILKTACCATPRPSSSKITSHNSGSPYTASWCGTNSRSINWSRSSPASDNLLEAKYKTLTSLLYGRRRTTSSRARTPSTSSTPIMSRSWDIPITWYSSRWIIISL